MKTKNNCIKAFTLVELLTVIIIAGIILLGITEGLSLIQRFVVSKQSQITKNIDIYDAYSRIESIIGNSDSVAISESNNLMFYSNNNYRSEIYKEESFLIITFETASDTVLQNISALNLIKSDYSYVSDTVAVYILYEDTINVCWKFTVPVVEEKIFSATVEDMEKDYFYD